LPTDLVLVLPEAGVDRVEWAKQLVGNAVRSPYTLQAYLYASNNSLSGRRAARSRASRCKAT
jgi:hypothetical protein